MTYCAIGTEVLERLRGLLKVRSRGVSSLSIDVKPKPMPEA
jgi:hypothetical protein